MGYARFKQKNPPLPRFRLYNPFRWPAPSLIRSTPIAREDDSIPTHHDLPRSGLGPDDSDVITQVLTFGKRLFVFPKMGGRPLFKSARRGLTH